MSKAQKEAAKLGEVGEEQVTDPATVEQLRKAGRELAALPKQECAASDSADSLRSGAKKYRQSQEAMDKQAGLLSRAADALARSRDAKALADAKQGLRGKQDEGSKLLADSEGKVADNASRESLQQAIADAGKVDSAQPGDYVKVQANLQGAIDAVNANVQAKADADAQAAAAAAAQAAQVAQVPVQRGQSYQPAYQPAQPAPQASQPAPQAPAPAAGGSGDKHYRIGTEHQQGTGGCAIGMFGNPTGNC
ncbi:hypothetical protein KIMH_01510 [Bombiscardovia apis]|uniref:Colicin transporter n=1 Tax=Bombiscardovia apis TaxID=2932182 RepID=A0ABM8BAW5_9BIFI|nr:hypothetical protein KIMH_01510 [Bombiscardovia apis]